MARVLVAPDSFKGSLAASQVAQALAAGLRAGWPGLTVEVLPVADGGEGTVQALVDATGGRIEHKTVTGPLGDPVEAFFGILGDGSTAVIEMAAASGLPLVPAHRRDARVTTTWGTGELIRAAAHAGCTRTIIGIGGSATNDGGAGMAQALGVRLVDASGGDLPPGGAALAMLDRVEMQDLDPAVLGMEILVACDVDNPLVGPTGASRVFGPQKGADEDTVAVLDKALSHYAHILARDLGADVARLPGAGAAGGLGAGLMAFLGGELRPGVDIVLEAVGLAERVAAVDLVVTGEGRIDSQTRFGKAPAGVARVAQGLGKPVVAVGGSVGSDIGPLYGAGISAVFSIVPGPMPLDEAMEHTAVLLGRCGEQLARLLRVGAGLPPVT